MGFSVLGFSVPVFVIGYLLIYVFAIQLNWLPVQGYQRLAQGVGGWAQRLILPSLTLSVVLIALIARITRTSVLEVMNEDYIRTARAKGQTERKVLVRHALANAAVPIAEPTVPSAGIGPRPRIRITFSTRFSTVNTMPSAIGVRASPADRSAPLTMKNTSMPLLNTNMMRRNGSACAFTAGAAFTRSSSQGDAK